jgi:hypothetical protein
VDFCGMGIDEQLDLSCIVGKLYPEGNLNHSSLSFEEMDCFYF